MIVFLNGASSTGKTTIARELQSVWKGPLVYLSLDSVISQLPFQYTGIGEKAAEGFEICQSVQNGEIQSVVIAGEYGRRLNKLAAMNARSISEDGFDLVIDYVLLDKELLEPFQHMLSDTEVCFVGVICDPQTLSRRNTLREDRANGLSCIQQESIHFCKDSYDLTVDTSAKSSKELAAKIAYFLGQNGAQKGMG